MLCLRLHPIPFIWNFNPLIWGFSSQKRTKFRLFLCLFLGNLWLKNRFWFLLALWRTRRWWRLSLTLALLYNTHISIIEVYRWSRFQNLTGMVNATVQSLGQFRSNCFSQVCRFLKTTKPWTAIVFWSIVRFTRFLGLTV